ncbi:MAG: ABC transporter permease [Bacilli bacterium]|nr:ABC transporter permease [Bacilli bacterium]
MISLKIALRFLKSSKAQTFLIVLGISVGVSVQVFIGSLIQGLQKDLVDSTIGNSSQVTVVNVDDNAYIEDYMTLSMQIEDSNEDIENLTYSLNTPGTLIYNSTTEPVLLRGMELNTVDGIYDLSGKVTSGRMPSADYEIIIGTSLFDKFNLSIGDNVLLQVPLIGETSLTIVGTYDFNVSTINDLWIISNITTAQTILNSGDVVSNIEMQVKDVFMANEIAVDLQEVVANSNYNITDWETSNAELLSALTAQSSSSYLIQVFVTISVILGITSVLAITVIQKSRQIGILKAMGIKDSQASLIFLSEGFILGIFGAIGGVLLGLGLAFTFSTFALDANGEPVIALFIDPTFILISALVAVFSASTASIIPARKSSKLSVMEVIKNG